MLAPLLKVKFIDSLLTWASKRNLSVDPFSVEAALEHKSTVDEKSGPWKPKDFRKLLLDWFPRKVTMAAPDREEVVPSLRAMVDYLADQGRLDASVHKFHAVLDEIAAFLAAMADERNYDMGKFWGTRMLEHDVDVTDESAMQRFIDATHTGEIEVDRDVLDEIVQRQFFSEPELEDHPELPPVQLPSNEELHTQIAASVMLNRLRSFVQWVGAGRALTKTRELRVSEARELVDLLQIDRSYVDKVRSSVDLPDVSLIVAWAKAARLVRGAKGTLVPIKSAAPLFNKPLELYRRVFEAFDQLGIYVCRGGGNRADISLLEQAFEDVHAFGLVGPLHGGRDACANGIAARNRQNRAALQVRVSTRKHRPASRRYLPRRVPEECWTY